MYRLACLAALMLVLSSHAVVGHAAEAKALPAAAPAASSTPAAAASAPSVFAAPPSDASNYRGDRVKFSFTVFVDRIVAATSGTEIVCAPAFTTFRGIGVLKVATEERPAFQVTSDPDTKDGRCGTAPVVAKGDIVTINTVALSGTPPDRYGLTFGTLMVPYKYHFRGDKDFSSGVSVGGYTGYRQEKSGLGIGAQYIVFLGAASIEVPQTADGKTTSQNMTGISYGVGVLGTLKDSFHMGLVLGADRVNASANYKDNGKVWIAVSLGYAFSN